MLIKVQLIFCPVLSASGMIPVMVYHSLIGSPSTVLAHCQVRKQLKTSLSKVSLFHAPVRLYSLTGTIWHLVLLCAGSSR
jgi:hypothetical protein